MGQGPNHLQGFVGTSEDAVVCEGCADIVFFGIDLHDFSDQRNVLENARRMLNAGGGRLVDLDWKKESPLQALLRISGIQKRKQLN